MYESPDRLLVEPPHDGTAPLVVVFGESAILSGSGRNARHADDCRRVSPHTRIGFDGSLAFVPPPDSSDTTGETP